MLKRYCNPANYVKKFVQLWHERFYDIDRFRSLEREKFERIGFKYDDAQATLNKILQVLGKPGFDEHAGMASVHWILFCCIRAVSTVRSVLEIGTYDGETALLLSHIFPNAAITTVDVPDDDPIFTSTYRRENSKVLRQFCEKRKENLANTRIRFIQKNSFFLPETVKGGFDLIWVDGGHLYPEIAWDLCNAYHLSSPGGWLLCDDVVIHKKGYRSEVSSPDSCQVLKYIRERSGDEITFFLKREAPVWSANPRKRKYIAVFRKKS
jgi:predicted O-methyltransferase YrrM